MSKSNGTEPEQSKKDQDYPIFNFWSFYLGLDNIDFLWKNVTLKKIHFKLTNKNIKILKNIRDSGNPEFHKCF